MSLNLDREAFYRRIKRFYTAWTKEGSQLQECESVLCMVGQNEEDQYRYAFRWDLCGHFNFDKFEERSLFTLSIKLTF